MSARRTILTICTAWALACSAATAPTAVADARDAGPSGGARWGPIRTLAPNPQGASIAVDGQGVITVAWSTTDFPPSVVVRQRFADGTWSEQAVVGQGITPVVVADRRGNVTAVWVTQREGHTDGVTAARLDGSGSWSAPELISHDVALPGYVPGPTVRGASDLDVAMNARGAVVVTWTWKADDGVPTRIQSAFRTPSGPWRTAVNVTPASRADEPEVGISADGTATVVYGVQAFGEPQKLISRRRSPEGRWGGPAVVAPEGYDHDVAGSGDGTTVVVFTPNFAKVRAATRHAVGKWRTRTISEPGAMISDADLALNRKGRAMVAMVGESRVDVVERAPGGWWSAPARVAGGTDASEVIVGLNAAGDAFVGWGTYALYGKYRPAGDDWGRRRTVSPDSGVEVLEWVDTVVAPDGDVAVLWDQEELPLRMRVLTTP